MATITRANIADTICEEIGLSRKDAGDILDMVVDEIRNALRKNLKSEQFYICLRD